MDLRPFISHAALRQRGPNEHNPSKRNLNKSGTMGGPQSRAAAVRTFPPTPAPTVSVSPQLYHANGIESANTKRLNLWLSFSRTVLCLFVCQSVLSWHGRPHPQYLITFFPLFFFPQSKSSNYAYHFSEKEGATKNLFLSSVERWVYGPCPKQCWISPDVVLL